MGIKDINPFLKSKNVECFKYADASRFSGKKVAIDAGGIFLRLASRTHSDLIMKLKNALDNYCPRLFFSNFMEHLLCELFFFLKNSISIIVVLEGGKDPDKEECVEKRKDTRILLKERIQNAKEEYRIVISDPLTYGASDEAERNLKKLRAQDFFFDRNLIPEIKRYFDNLGIPYVTAKYDAEFLCCNLVLEGKADTVFTVDTDCYAFGIDYMITGFNTYQNTFEITNIREIINFFEEELNLEYNIAKKALRDFCIMCGCDFNTRYPNIGPVKSFKLLQKYKRLFLIDEKDFSCLKNHICSVKFSYEPTNIYEEDLMTDWGRLISNGHQVLSEFSSKDLLYLYSHIRSNIT